MFPHIVVSARRLINVIPLEARIRRIFPVHAPTDALRIQQVHDRLDFRLDALEMIADRTVSGPPHSSDVVRLRRMGNGAVICQEDALGCKICEAG